MRIIITGASKGLGKVLAQEFSLAGHYVGLIARNQDALNQLHKALSEKNGADKVFISACDLNKPEDVQSTLKLLIAKMGGVDVLINNASIIVKLSLLDMSNHQWHESMGTGINSTFFCSRAVIPHFIQQKKGHIINIGSLSSKIPLERGISYAASKHALNGLTKSMVHEFHSYGIKICTIHPGAFSIDIDDGADWKMPATEVFRACNYVLNAHPKAFVEELIIRPINWPE